MRWRVFLPLIALVSGGCASTQLNYNTLDLGSTVDRLLVAQVVHNVSNFIDSPLAVPSQLVINSGSAQTANTVTGSYFDPLTKALTVATSIPASGAASVTKTSVNAAKTLTLGGNNVSTQNWAFEPIHDSDQLRRLYALYRFVVTGNDDENAQIQLIYDYPIHYVTPSADSDAGKGRGSRDPVPDPTALLGPNCVLCLRGSDSAQYSNGASTICRSRNVPLSAPSLRTPNIQVQPTWLCINRRLLPDRDKYGNRGFGSWLRWTDLTDAGPACPQRRDGSCVPRSGDIPIGQSRTRILYVDGNQPERFAEFMLFISVAAESGESPSASSSGRRGRGGGPASLVLIP
jgi:hypothetical protein